MRQYNYILIITVLAMICCLFVLNIVLENYKDNQVLMFQEGYNNGTRDVALILFDKAVKCEAIPLSNETVGINLIAAECLPEEVIEYLKGRQQNG